MTEPRTVKVVIQYMAQMGHHIVKVGTALMVRMARLIGEVGTLYMALMVLLVGNLATQCIAIDSTPNKANSLGLPKAAPLRYAAFGIR